MQPTITDDVTLFTQRGQLATRIADHKKWIWTYLLDPHVESDFAHMKFAKQDDEGQVYNVVLTFRPGTTACGYSCTCRDMQFPRRAYRSREPGMPCKHIERALALWPVLRALGTSTGGIMPPASGA